MLKQFRAPPPAKRASKRWSKEYIATATQAYNKVNCQAFIASPWEDVAFAPFMGPLDVYSRLPNDVLHNVSPCVIGRRVCTASVRLLRAPRRDRRG